MKRKTRDLGLVRKSLKGKPGGRMGWEDGRVAIGLLWEVYHDARRQMPEMRAARGPSIVTLAIVDELRTT